MLKYKSTTDTICALATPPGHGGIAVIRVSGPESTTICRKLMKLPEEIDSHRAFFLTVKDIAQSKNIDEAIVSYFQKDKSYTGDETLEISCHGSPAITEEILQNLILAGCRHAEKGEFTFRAFMSGRMDLVQAESVLSLIESETKKAAEVSLRQLRGELSQKIQSIKNKTTHLLAHMEAGIDFSMEGLETISEDEIYKEILDIKKETQALSDSYTEGKVLTDCYTIALAGEPNVGKSSLFNAFLGNDRAIVTEVAGTTRDAIEGYLVLSGIKVRFVDTAGLRDTSDIVEKIGIQKTKEQIEQADLIFYVLDSTAKDLQIDPETFKSAKNKTIFVANKNDLPEANQNFIEKKLQDFQTRVFFVSAKNKSSLTDVIGFVEEKLKKSFNESSAVVLKSRQFELLTKINECLARAEDLSKQKSSHEFMAFELRDSLEGLMELLGDKFDDQVLEKVFQEFCIGK